MDTINRDRVINAIVYISQNTLHCGKIKLFKLLYLIDFEHFRSTGHSMTGYKYQAWEYGPVPAELMSEWNSMKDDLLEAIHIEKQQIIDFARQNVVANEGVEFIEGYFTNRQLRIMDQITEQYRTTFSNELIDVTHTHNGAWDKVWDNGNGSFETIPYMLSVPEDDQNREYILQCAEEASGISQASAGGNY